MTWHLTPAMKWVEHVRGEYFGRICRVQTGRADLQGIQVCRQVATDLQAPEHTHIHPTRVAQLPWFTRTLRIDLHCGKMCRGICPMILSEFSSSQMQMNSQHISPGVVSTLLRCEPFNWQQWRDSQGNKCCCDVTSQAQLTLRYDVTEGF